MKIQINNLKARVRLGCTSEERAYPQGIELDLTLFVDDHRSTKSDELADTVDYMAVFSLVEQICSAGEYKLVEKLAFQIAAGLRELSPMINDVEITVRKKVLPSAESMGVSLLLSSCRST